MLQIKEENYTYIFFVCLPIQDSDKSQEKKDQ